MGRKGIWIALIALLLAGLGPAAWAESHEEEATPVTPSFMYVWTDHVALANAQAYETEVGTILEKIRETEEGKELEYFALSTPGSYAYVIPIGELGNFAKANTAFMAATNAVGGIEVWDGAQKLVERGSGHFLVSRPDLSYKPAAPREAEATGRYRHHEWWYVRPGHEVEIEGVARKIAALYAEKEIDTGFRIYQALTGDDLPLYVVTMTGASAADHYANEERIDAALGDAAQALIGEAVGLARRVERTASTVRPELSMGM